MDPTDLNRTHFANQNPEGGHEAAIESGESACEAPDVTEPTSAESSHTVPKVSKGMPKIESTHGKSNQTIKR